MAINRDVSLHGYHGDLDSRQPMQPSRKFRTFASLLRPILETNKARVKFKRIFVTDIDLHILMTRVLAESCPV